MAVYAIGDIQGCYHPLTELLAALRFDPMGDRLWFTGDLVNRGPDSLRALRLVRDLGDRAVVVLGNHDLHLLAVAAGARTVEHDDTFESLLAAPDRDDLLAWLQSRPVAVHDAELGVCMVHAGLAPQWSVPQALGYAQELQDALRSERSHSYFQHMTGDTPTTWHPGLTGWPRLRAITNAFTRLRYCDAQGAMCLHEKGPPGSARRGLRPWFELRAQRADPSIIVFGHWSALGLIDTGRVIGLDSGCVWGGHLTAVRLAPGPRSYRRVSCGTGHGAA